MIEPPHPFVAGSAGRAGLWEVIRFYQAALVNTAFGCGVYALLLWLGLGRFPAQALAYVCGTAFNYLSYSLHVFHDRRGSRWRFVAAYAGTYALNVALLAAFSRWVRSPLAAGVLASLAASAVNYLALKLFVFARAPRPA